eukprot:s1060_g9.t2
MTEVFVQLEGSPYAATLFLQMELCKDKTLHNWISEQNGMENADHEKRYQEAKSILTQCLRALAYLHNHSCVHRDVKPSNLLFGQDDAMRLADFGLAKWLEFSFSKSVPHPGAASPRFVREASAMRLRPARPASAPALRSAQAPAVPVTPLQLLRARAPARPTSAWAPPVAAEASHADETSVAEPAASLSKGGEDCRAGWGIQPTRTDRSQGDRGDRCTCEASESSLVSTQQPLHSETSQELDLPEEDPGVPPRAKRSRHALRLGLVFLEECDDANEAELQGKVEALRRKELHEKWRKLRQQQKELEEEQQEVQKLLQRTPKRTPGRPQSAASGTRRSGISGSAAELRIEAWCEAPGSDGKAISGTTSRVTPKSRPSSSPGALRRSASAPGQRQEESMRRQAAQRLDCRRVNGTRTSKAKGDPTRTLDTWRFSTVKALVRDSRLHGIQTPHGRRFHGGLQLESRLLAMHSTLWKAGHVRDESCSLRLSAWRGGIRTNGPERAKGHRGMNAGTPCYASPEQLAGKPLETSTDLFSLGIVLAELICPVQTQMERTKVLEALKEKRTLPTSSQLADMAVRMTAPEPMMRPSAKELLEELGEEVPEFDAEHCPQNVTLLVAMTPSSTGVLERLQDW